jgi:hypothetical protein
MRRSKSSMTTMQAANQTSEKVDALVKKSFDNAANMMAKAGYKIPNNVKVTVDPQLPFMGYTMPTRHGFHIVVAGGAVGSGLLEGLLMHEMGHIYRITTNHPSHNAQILEEAIERLGMNIPEYQQKIIHDLLNDIQDLYADDLTFKALRNSPVIGLDQLTEFLQSWVKDAPLTSGNPTQDRWTNTSLMTHNARAMAQMARHRVKDTGGRASKANQAFLDHVDPDIASEFDYFQNTLVGLREDMTENDYRKLLAEYLNKFVQIAEKG